MNVYFARSIRGQHSERDEIINNLIVSIIKELGHTPTLELPTITGDKRESTNRYIYRRDLAWINQSQAMIAECSNPSLGVGYEIAYAKHVRNIPVLVIARADVRLSAMIAGADSIDMFYYGTDDNIRTGVEAFLKDEVMFESYRKLK